MRPTIGPAYPRILLFAAVYFVASAALDPVEVTGLGFGLSLYTADGKPNTNFGDGPFKLVVHGVEVVSE